MPYFPWGEDDDEAPDWPDEVSNGDERTSVSSSDPDDAIGDDD